MNVNIMLVSFLVLAIPVAEALSLVAKKWTGGANGNANHGAQFISVLRRRLEPAIVSDANAGARSTRKSQRVQVSRAQLAALRRVHSLPSQNKSETFELPKTIIRNLGAEYVGSIGIGTASCGPDKKDCSHAEAQSTLTSIVFDTGSTNLWMASTLCDKSPCTNTDRQRYNPTRSKTYHECQERTNLDVTFGSAELKGPLGIDDFHIGPFTVKNQVFALIAEEYGSAFESLPLEGIVGLAFPSMSASNQTPFFDTVMEQGVLRRNMFSFYLSYGDSHETGDSLSSDDSHMFDVHGAKTGAILWGGYDESLFEGPLMWFPVTKAHYWAIDLLDFRIGNESFPVTGYNDLELDLLEAPRQSYVIFDTGTTYYTADGALFQNLQSRLASAHCNNVEHYPPLTYVLEDINGVRRELTISQEDYMTSEFGGYNCDLAFMEIGVPADYGPAMLLGELFMQKYFTVFDRGSGGDGDARIGIARSRNRALSSLLEQSETM